MNRGSPLLWSIIAHAALVGVVTVIAVSAREERERDRERRSSGATRLELVDVQVEAPVPRKAEVVEPMTATSTVVATTPVRRAARRARSAETRAVETQAVETQAPETGSGSSSGNGSGSGSSNGNGNGSGNGGGGGDGGGGGGGMEAPRLAFERMVAAPRSKARAARLVYPKREGDETPQTLFIAVVTVDRDGSVVGASIKHAPSTHLADRALSAVFRFAYDPALDDAGNPVSSTVEQRFVVQ